MLERKRSDIITPLDIDKIFKIHGGNSYKEIKITNSQFVGRKFGEFVATKVPAK
jgi:ribosomal protein S19